MTTINNLDKSLLHEIAHANTTSEAIFLTLALRERKRYETDLRRLRQELVREGFKIVSTDFNHTFKRLADAGVGEYVQAPGQLPRFKWHFNTIDTCYLALGEARANKIKAEKSLKKKQTDALSPKSPVRVVPTKQKRAKRPLPLAITAPTSMPRHLTVVLPGGRIIDITAPNDLTSDESKYITTQLVKAL